MNQIKHSAAAALLNTIYHFQHHDLCEQLGGWRNDIWMELTCGDGEPTVAANDHTSDMPHMYSLCRRAVFDRDYEIFVWTQVADSRGNSEWEHILLLNSGDNDWVPMQVWSWGIETPSYTEVGAAVDEHVLRRR